MSFNPSCPHETHAVHISPSNSPNNGSVLETVSKWNHCLKDTVIRNPPKRNMKTKSAVRPRKDPSSSIRQYLYLKGRDEETNTTPQKLRNQSHLFPPSIQPFTQARKRYRKIMLNRKLNPTGPKKRKFVISRHTCKRKQINELNFNMSA